MTSDVLTRDRPSDGVIDILLVGLDSRTDAAGNPLALIELANALGSVDKGMPKGDLQAAWFGQLMTSEWESDNGKRSKNCIKAYAVGLNLEKGRSTAFARDRIAARSAEQADGASPEPFGVEDEDLQAGRDYEVDTTTLGTAEADDLDREPANA